MDPGWGWGWRSNRSRDAFRFWHKHFAGKLQSDGSGQPEDMGEDCADELKQSYPLIWCLWEDVSTLLLKGHTLVRCYANGLQYGSDGTVHTDSVVQTSYTSVYYPHAQWNPDWGGETMFYDLAKTEILGCSYPKPGRLVCFPGTVPHRAAGVSRTCPVLRVTLMFKTYYEKDHAKDQPKDHAKDQPKVAP
jgi:SM-20-related protein